MAANWLQAGQNYALLQSCETTAHTLTPPLLGSTAANWLRAGNLAPLQSSYETTE
jgi:hypothetical protein